MICPNCNQNIAEGLKFCSECGAPLTTPNPTYNNPVPPVNNSYNQHGISGNQYASTSLRFGIIGTCLDLTVFLSIVGLILGIVGIKKAGNASRMGVKSGKQKAGLILSIISLVLALVIPFAFMASCVSNLKSKGTAASTALVDNKEIISQLKGTYVGNNGSVLIMRDDMTSNYYYPGFGISNNKWSIKDNRIEMFISNCFSNVYADIDPNNTDTIYLESDSSLWDAETFTKVSTDSAALTTDQCDELLKNNGITPVATLYETQATSKPTQSTTQATATTADTTSSGSTSKTVNGMSVKEACDAYEAYMDKYIELYKGMMDGSLSYLETLNEINELQGEMDELEEALNALSEADMTPEDYQYYLEVMTRVSKKMLEIY